jgi:hypothetical protein
MLDHGAEHLKLRQLDMPANFFIGNNAVAEAGHFPSNLLLGVSTPGSDVRLRRQMHARPGEPITVAGNPPIRFGTTSPTECQESPQLPSFPLFLARVSLNDLLGIGMLPTADVLAYAALYTIAMRTGADPIVAAPVALLLTEAVLVVACVLVKLALVGRWGSAHSTPFWSLRHFTYFFAQDCFFAWCRSSLSTLAGTVLANPVLRQMGCRIGRRTIVTSPLQASDWNAVRFGDDCVVDGFLQLHTFENMELKVKRADIEARSTVSFGATVMSGAVIEAETTLQPLSMVLKEMHLTTGIYEGSPAEPASPTGGSDRPPAQLQPGIEPVPFGEPAVGRQPARVAVPDESER